ncbi:MAG: ABC transporter substrate-binding protein [Crocinitomicaceae bacterium]|nr:ABC transporter substrate-binding protein [Crocinitomicaceae bacterium]
MKYKLPLLLLAFLALTLLGCSNATEKGDSTPLNEVERIISLSGAITETVYELGRGDQLIAVDVTSTYPAALPNAEKLGHTSSLKAEGLISLDPTVIIFEKGTLDQTLIGQLQSADIRMVGVEKVLSVEGAKQFIMDIAKALSIAEAQFLIDQIDRHLAEVSDLIPVPKVLFIYGRGAGSLMVAGEKTSLDEVIRLAGAQNAVSGFQDFKPLSNEVLIAANPDVVLLFESAKESLNGINGILDLPGMKETTAGQKQQILFMDGQLLSGFGPRLGQAVAQLNKLLQTNE